jgi:hypothetical protein
MSVGAKIYIQDFHPKNLLNKLPLLDEYFKSQITDTAMYSINEGLFCINNKGVYELKQIDKPVKHYKNYYRDLNTNKTVNLILDESYYEKTMVLSQLPADYLYITTTVFEFYSNPKVKLIVEGNLPPKEIIDPKSAIMQLSSKSRYSNFTPTDFYFQTNEDIENYFIKEELNVFLSMLN